MDETSTFSFQNISRVFKAEILIMKGTQWGTTGMYSVKQVSSHQ